MLVAEMMEKARAFYPKTCGVICGDEKFTYSQFGERVDHLSNALLDLGLQKNDAVAILHRNCHYYPEAYFAAMKGVVVLQEGPEATEEEIIAFCRGNIAHHKAPKSVDLIRELPKTGSGKIYKKGLRDQYRGDQAKNVS